MPAKKIKSAKTKSEIENAISDITQKAGWRGNSRLVQQVGRLKSKLRKIETGEIK